MGYFQYSINDDGGGGQAYKSSVGCYKNSGIIVREMDFFNNRQDAIEFSSSVDYVKFSLIQFQGEKHFTFNCEVLETGFIPA